jgi:hypothetical protein
MSKYKSDCFARFVSDELNEKKIDKLRKHESDRFATIANIYENLI